MMTNGVPALQTCLPISAGTLLIQDGTLLPDSMHLTSMRCSQSWTSATNFDCTQMEGQLRQAGWTFFFMAGRIRTSAFGFDVEKRLRTAVRRATEAVQSMSCNCVEITAVATRSFLGLPYVSLSVQPRHIQSDNRFHAN